MREKCALSHGSGVLGRDPRDSCRFWSPHVENVCTVTQIRLGEGGGGGYHWGGGGGRRTENRDHIYICLCMTWICTNLSLSVCFAVCFRLLWFRFSSTLNRLRVFGYG